MPQTDKKTVFSGRPTAVAAVSKRLRAKITLITKRLANSKRFLLLYMIFSLVVLVGTAVVWSYLGARLQQSNADQLSDPLLFSSPATFHGATFPAQHSFLLKWPVFYLIKLAGYSTVSFVVATMGVAITTVLLFAGVLYRIDRRPLIFGTLCLALASCLLLVPAQPYAGGLLPVNMAMVTTRNLEYILYIFSLIFVARQPKFNSWRFWVAVILLGLVCASDRLFLDISIGGALMATIVYGMRKRWNLVSLSVNWLFVGIMAGAIALGALWVIDGAQVTHVAGQSGTSPYAAVHTVKGLVLAGGYAISDLFTNFGANPAYDGTVVRQIPHLAQHRILSASGISYLINASILLYGLYICSRFLLAGLLKKRARTIKPSTPFRLTNMMIWTSLAAIGVFMVSNHDYAVDSRYLTISLFTVFIALSAYASRKRLQPTKLLMIAILLCIGMGAAAPQLLSIQRSGQQALAGINDRNNLIARALATHRTTIVVGDYWRVLPIQVIAHNQPAVAAFPLQNCTEPRTVLSSEKWQPNLHDRKFAYLESFDKSLTDFPQCDQAQITKFFGPPNATELIAGTLEHPIERLLFYDQGIHNRVAGATISTIAPITLDDLPHTSCPVPTVMNIVAHEDDDILFMNPDTSHELQIGHCVRTVYMTAGDDGQDRGYWLSRQRASETAYSAMIGNKEPWVERVVRLNSHEFITVANPHGNDQVSLIFVHLPDGNLSGQGFGSTHAESLAGLYKNKIKTMHSVDDQSVYTSEELTSALNDLMITYQPTAIHTQSEFHGTQFTDHSDHEAVGLYVNKAYALYEQQQYEGQVTVPIKYYVGYPVRQFPVNLTQDQIKEKIAIFLQYSMFDGAVCHSVQQCTHTDTYNGYLQRQYQNPN